MKRILIVIACFIFIFLGIKLYSYIRIKTAKVEVILIDDLNLEFSSKRKVSSFIKSINGKIIDDYVIDSTVLGEKKVKFKFINDDNIKLSYQYKVNVVDTKEPLIWLGKSISIAKGADINLEKTILCGDNYDPKPKCFVEGDYDVNTVGNYELVFKAIDSSGNSEQVPFMLKVYEPVTNKEEIEKSFTDFNEVLKKYKTSNNKIGIDVSHWQGKIDFDALKNAGVEFIMIRLGGTKGTNGEYFIDKYFKRNIVEAKKHNIEVGVYFYSYADSVESSLKDSNWVIKQLKKYDLDLSIAFDWEEWRYFNDYNLSFFGLTSIADTFLGNVEKHGYKGMLYSSKNYLENVWMENDYDIWLAHYTDKTDYKGKYKMWQICENGIVDGINGTVDIDIMY